MSHLCSRCGLVVKHLFVLTWVNSSWSTLSPRWVARWGLGWPLCLIGLLDRELVIRPASRGFLAEIWSYASPRWVVLWGLGHTLHLAELLDEDLVGRSASLGFLVEGWSTNGSEGGCGPTMGYPVCRYPIVAPEPSCDSLELCGGFLYRSYIFSVCARTSTRCSPRAPKPSLWIAWGFIRFVRGISTNPSY
jgi:hypothetical protein